VSTQDPAAAERRQECGGWYEAHVATLREFTSAVEILLERALQSSGVQYDAVTARVKSRENFLDKCVLPADAGTGSGFKYAEPIEAISDIAGVRVTTYLLQTIPQLQRVVESTFATPGPENRHSFEDGDVPGYQSVHYLVELPENRLILDENRKFRGLRAEVQVRTVLQHAWAQIQHGVMYKGDRQIPGQLRRRLIALAGLLELADSEFKSVSDDLDRSLEVVAQAAHVAVEGANLTPLTLRMLLHHIVGSTEGLDDAWFEELHGIIVQLRLDSADTLEQLLAGDPDVVGGVRAALTTAAYVPTVVEVVDGVIRYLQRENYFQLRPEWHAFTERAREEARQEQSAFCQRVLEKMP